MVVAGGDANDFLTNYGLNQNLIRQFQSEFLRFVTNNEEIGTTKHHESIAKSALSLGYHLLHEIRYSLTAVRVVSSLMMKAIDLFLPNEGKIKKMGEQKDNLNKPRDVLVILFARRSKSDAGDAKYVQQQREDGWEAFLEQFEIDYPGVDPEKDPEINVVRVEPPAVLDVAVSQATHTKKEIYGTMALVLDLMTKRKYQKAYFCMSRNDRGSRQSPHLFIFGSFIEHAGAKVVVSSESACKLPRDVVGGQLKKENASKKRKEKKARKAGVVLESAIVLESELRETDAIQGVVQHRKAHVQLGEIADTLVDEFRNASKGEKDQVCVKAMKKMQDENIRYLKETVPGSGRYVVITDPCSIFKNRLWTRVVAAEKLEIVKLSTNEITPAKLRRYSVEALRHLAEEKFNVTFKKKGKRGEVIDVILDQTRDGAKISNSKPNAKKPKANASAKSTTKKRKASRSADHHIFSRGSSFLFKISFGNRRVSYARY